MQETPEAGWFMLFEVELNTDFAKGFDQYGRMVASCRAQSAGVDDCPFSFDVDKQTIVTGIFVGDSGVTYPLFVYNATALDYNRLFQLVEGTGSVHNHAIEFGFTPPQG